MRTVLIRTSCAVALASACGRVSYDPLPGAGDTGVDAADVGLDARPPLDAGDDGSVAVMEPPPDAIFRSVGPGRSAALASGAGNPLEVSGSMASFAAAIPDFVGVGDALSYDSDGDGVTDTLAFIHGRVSSMAYFVATETGDDAPPTASPDESWLIHRAYTSLADAVTGAVNPAVPFPFDAWSGANDLVASGKSWHVACYADAPDVTTTAVNDWVTSATAYLRIFTPFRPSEVGASQRHRGAWDDARYHVVTPSGSNDRALLVRDAYVRVEGLQIWVDTEGALGDLPHGIDVVEVTRGTRAYLSDNVIRGSDALQGEGSIPRGIKLHAAEAGATFYVWNNVIYDFGGGETARGVELTGAESTAYIYSNTIFNVTPAILANHDLDVLHVRNTVALQCIRCFSTNRGEYFGSNNRTTDDSAVALGIGAQLSSEVVTDYFASPGDLHLSSTAPRVAELRDVGADLSSDPDLALDRDIDGMLRGPLWDIGADEL